MAQTLKPLNLDLFRAARRTYHKALTVYQETSGEAWLSVLPYLSDVDAQIVAAIGTNCGATSDHIEAMTGLKHQTVSAQIRHMVEAGLIRDSGERGRTRSGRRAILWKMK